MNKQFTSLRQLAQCIRAGAGLLDTDEPFEAAVAGAKDIGLLADKELPHEPDKLLRELMLDIDPEPCESDIDDIGAIQYAIWVKAYYHNSPIERIAEYIDRLAMAQERGENVLEAVGRIGDEMQAEEQVAKQKGKV